MSAIDERGVESGYPHTLRPELHKAREAARVPKKGMVGVSAIDKLGLERAIIELAN